MTTPDDEVEFTGADMGRKTDVIGLVRQSLATRTEFEARPHRNCKLTECLGRPRCERCLWMDAKEDGATPTAPTEPT